ncbi:unnamed protein product [Eruca vesicaria subsp. sativa]|uniref:Uncharacterized protein n=1 Tax=Eruca vesicaria subsp. sativa TaxID=29727 RepID=A0ABC8K749_ERUVS|nr:unnamed protein product [Eruca vesicaria subsp. sativa]
MPSRGWNSICSFCLTHQSCWDQKPTFQCLKRDVLPYLSWVGPHCLYACLEKALKSGDKWQCVKRSVIGRQCRIGSNVKGVNSVVMDPCHHRRRRLFFYSRLSHFQQCTASRECFYCQVEAGYVVFLPRG